ncbi:MAG: site-2 protease family protein [bacterium]|nr:site-2 protease family protein [bacterium]MDZ4231440.1 site-2 protease family protein [Patescibacteria group bacterium]
MFALATLALLVLLILAHEFGHFLAAKLLGIRVDEFGVGFPPRLVSKKWGETTYSLNLLPFGGFVKIFGESGEVAGKNAKRSFAGQAFWKKSVVILSGVLMNFLVGWIALSAVFAIGSEPGILIEQVAPGSPADEAGFEAGELITGFGSSEEFIQYIDEHRGETIILNDKEVTPRTEVPQNEGALGIGFVFNEGLKLGFFESLGRGFVTAAQILGAIFVALGGFLWGVLTGNFDVLGQVSGPVGVFVVVKEATELGLVYLVQLLGLISLNLAVLNTIPFPALDGGRFLFTALQKVFGKKIFNKKLEMVVNIAGFVFLITLMILVTIKDIISL